MKKYKKELILSCLATLIPVFIGLILWNKLPDTVPSHFGINGEADNFSSKAFTVFVPSLIFVLANILCFSATLFDKKNKAQNPKVIKLILAIMPTISILTNGMIYFSALNLEFNIALFVFLLLGITLILIGNYLPKTKQNFTIGIKIKWTLISEENWNKTHRFAGKLWVIVGILSIISIFLPERFIPYVLFLFIIAALVPMLYSYLYYKKQLKEGSVDKNAKIDFNNYGKKSSKAAIIIAIIIFIFIFIILFTGEIKYSFSDSQLEIKATYWTDAAVSYDKIDSVEYRENFDFGLKTNGYSSPKLLMGQFKNDEFSYYTIYAYTKCKSAVVLSNGKTHLVINCDTAEKTKELYETLLSKTAKE